MSSGSCQNYDDHILTLEKMYTCYFPYTTNNLYANNIKRLLMQSNIESISLTKCLRSVSLFRRCSVFNFNWFENLEGKNSIECFVEYILKIMFLHFLHLSRKKMVFTFHNKQPHNKKRPHWSTHIMHTLCEYSDAIIAHCPETEAIVRSMGANYVKKIVHIPHPNYCSNYEGLAYNSYRQQYGFSNDDLVFLFFGVVSPYKNLELLLDVFQELNHPKAKLLIAGNPVSQAYRNKLLDIIGVSNDIVTDFRNIPDEELPSLFKTSDIVALLYDKDSSLNSGAVYLSFSLKRTVICPDIGTIQGLKDQSIVYHYDYQSFEEHKNKVSEVFQTVLSQHLENPQTIREMGDRAYTYLQQQHDDLQVQKLYAKLYRNIVN